MRKKIWIAGALAGLLIATGCHAGWLHPAFEGEFCAHNHKYIVDNSGSVLIQTKLYGRVSLYNAGMDPTEKQWTTEIAFEDLADLDNVIGDLQKVSKEMHQKADGGCKPSCGD